MKLFCFGFGYTASFFANKLDWEEVTGTHRDDFPLDINLRTKLVEATHILCSIPPDEGGDILIRENYDMDPKWIGYLSTTGVYGNHDGGWVDEEIAANPTQERSKWRMTAENQWLESSYPVEIFRLSGIYGPGEGRNALSQLKSGTAKRIEKPNQFFSRIHVEDIAEILKRSAQNPSSGEIYNCADDFPCSQAEVVEYAAKLMDISPPPLVPFEEADLSPMARSFYSNSRRVKNDKVKEKLGMEFAFPTYKEGLEQIWGSF